MEPNWYRSRFFEVHALVRDGRGPSVVLLHGAAGNALTWLPVLDAFDDRRVVLVDLPGHGESPPVEAWSLELLARALADAIGSREGPSVVWGGHSWGGKTAAILAAVRPEMARALLLVDPSPASPVPIRAEEFVDAALAPELGPWPNVETAIETARGLPQYRTWNEAIERAFRRGLCVGEQTVRSRVEREWLVSISEAALLHDDAPTIEKIACPTLLLFAEQSLRWQEPTNGRALRPLAHVQTIELPGHHWLTYEPPEPLMRHVRSWLSEVAP